jgi:metal-dependent hydrolase (beta-lactamase superfamily II)
METNNMEPRITILSENTGIKELKIKKMALCHCTGMPAITRIAHQFRDSFLYSNAGTIIKLP